MMPGNEPLPNLAELLATDLNGYFSQLMLRYQQRLYAFALRQSGSPQDAQDIVQEAFIRAYHALADYPEERIRMMKLQPWLYKITLHVFYRHKGNDRFQSASLDLSEESIHLEIEDDERMQPEQIRAFLLINCAKSKREPSQTRCRPWSKLVTSLNQQPTRGRHAL